MPLLSLPNLDGWFDSNQWWTHNLVAMFLNLLANAAVARFIASPIMIHLFSNEIRRKLVHIMMGPVFMTCWNLYSSKHGEWFAVVVPSLFTVQFLLLGLGLLDDPSTVKSLSRSGERSEILRGPVIYGVTFMVSTLFFWRNSPHGIIALSILCGGDGLADIVGRRFGSSNRYPFSMGKSFAGSLGMFVGGFGLSLVMLSLFEISGNFAHGKFSVWNSMISLCVINVVCTIVEAITHESWFAFFSEDNITVTITALTLSLLLS